MSWDDKMKAADIVKAALKEDIGKRDITTLLTLPGYRCVKAVLRSGERGIICGLGVARLVFKTQDKNIHFAPKVKDGQEVNKGKILAVIYGRARSILAAERAALNFLSMMSGIASLTKKFTRRIKPYKTKIMDTRKTSPGLRSLEKYAVRTGGGYNHRFALDEMVLIKDNHLKAAGPQGRRAANIKEIIGKVKEKVPGRIKIEIEVKNLKEFKDAIQAGPDIIMLDNMKIAGIKKALMLRRRMPNASCRALIEVSGGVTLKNVRKIAAAGVDMISIGALTHSCKALDISLDIIA